ncbi:MAG TPA: metallophosphoesterase [Pirellulaceae bacterium]|nr:metallophosphoesterase [Pirellulaceae bacterium]
MIAPRVALFGGIYSNYLALEAAIADARRRGVDAIYCLGDLGAFGPHPDRAIELLRRHDIACVRGNYDDSIGNELADCQCGYADPRDNHFAQISYDYTLENTSVENRRWLKSLPSEIRFTLGEGQVGNLSYGSRVLLCHGSPRRINEFLWESTTPTHFLDHLASEHNADVICCTHTGLKWQRELTGSGVVSGPRSPANEKSPAGNDSRPLRPGKFLNVGVLGRPENDGKTNVWYTLLSASDGAVSAPFIPVEYDHHRLAAEMRDQRLPDEFIETILTGCWTTCLEVLPAKERRRGKM